MEKEKITDFLNELKEKELCFQDFRDMKELLKKMGSPDGQLSEVLERKPHSMILKKIGLVKTLKLEHKLPKALLYLFKLEKILLKDEAPLLIGKIQEYDLHQNRACGRPVEVELLMGEVTDKGEESNLRCL